MKRIFLIFNIFFLTNVCANECKNKSIFPNFVINSVAYLAIKIHDLAKNVSNNKIFHKILEYIDISDHSLRSNYLLIINRINENNYHVLFINLYNLKLLKEKFQIPEPIEISKEIYENLKKLASHKLECFFKEDNYNIKLPNEEFFILKKNSQNLIEALILSNENVSKITHDIYGFDYNIQQK